METEQPRDDVHGEVERGQRDKPWQRYLDAALGLRNYWYPVFFSHELKEGETRPETLLGERLFELCLFGRLERGLVDVVECPFLANSEDDLVTFQVDHHISGQFFALKINIQLLQSKILKLDVFDCFRISCFSIRGIRIGNIGLSSQRRIIVDDGFVLDDGRRCSCRRRGAID